MFYCVCCVLILHKYALEISSKHFENLNFFISIKIQEGLYMDINYKAHC